MRWVLIIKPPPDIVTTVERYLSVTSINLYTTAVTREHSNQDLMCLLEILEYIGYCLLLWVLISE